MVKTVVDVDGLDEIMKLLPEDEQQAFNQLDAIHMKSLREYIVSSKLTHAEGRKVRTKQDLVASLVAIVLATRKQQRLDNANVPLSDNTREYAKNAVDECHDLITTTDKYCKTRYTLLSSDRRKKCKARKGHVNSSEFRKMEDNIKRLSRPSTVDATEIGAAGDIGEYLGTCRAIGCSSLLAVPGKGRCSKAFRS